MTRRFATLLALCALIAAPRVAQAQDPGEPGPPLAEPGSELRVWLVTASPGDAVWERFGHNAIRILDTRTGRDASYNWGIFDFNQPGFIPRFLKGEMLYMMAPYQTGPMIESYERTDRQVVMQELAMTPAQKLQLRDLADLNALPENREYFYDYFRDNCSTRVRDMLDAVLGGALYEQLGRVDNGVSFRTHTRRLTQIDPVVFTGMDVLLGSPGDVPIFLWDEMFIPMVLRDAIREATTSDAEGNVIPLVMNEEVVVQSTRAQEPARADSWFLRFLVLGVLAGAVLFGLGRAAAGGSKPASALFGVLAVSWSVLAGVFGLILVLVLFTDHWSMRWNESLFLLNPISLWLAAFIPLALLGRAREKALRLAKATLAVAVFGLFLQVLPATQQSTWMLFALFLPVHLGIVLGLDRLVREPAGS